HHGDGADGQVGLVHGDHGGLEVHVLGMFGLHDVHQVVEGDDADQLGVSVDDGEGHEVVVAQLFDGAFLVLVNGQEHHILVHQVLDGGFKGGGDELAQG